MSQERTGNTCADIKELCLESGKPVVKPGSVVGNHSSRRPVASTLKQPTRKQREPRHTLPYLALLQMGFAVPSVLPRPR